ncbi:hypothetical protein CsSME_00045826 [Camellia sinensis var. sinensis]
MAGVITPIPSDSYKLGFIGAGKMAESIARGVVKSGLLPASRIRTAHLGSARRAAFESFGVKVVDLNNQVHQSLISSLPSLIFTCMLFSIYIYI